MSRYTMHNVTVTKDMFDKVVELCSTTTSARFPAGGNWEIAYGFDHAVGYFLSFYPVSEGALLYVRDEDDVIDLDSMFTHFTGAELGYLLSLFNGDRNHIDLAYLDLEF